MSAFSWAANAVAPPTREEIRATTDEVFTSSDFARNKSLIRRALEWIGDHLQLPGGGGPPGSGSVSIFTILLLVAFIAIVGWAAYFIVTRWVPRVTPDDSDDVEVELTEVRSTAEWRTTAEAHESAGEWKQAVRARFREIVGELIDRGVLDPAAGRTTGEFRSDMARTCPPALASFDRASELFELPWYANEPTGPVENAEIRSLGRVVVDIVSHHTVQPLAEVAR